MLLQRAKPFVHWAMLLMTLAETVLAAAVQPEHGLIEQRGIVQQHPHFHIPQGNTPVRICPAPYGKQGAGWYSLPPSHDLYKYTCQVRFSETGGELGTYETRTLEECCNQCSFHNHKPENLEMPCLGVQWDMTYRACTLKRDLTGERTPYAKFDQAILYGVEGNVTDPFCPRDVGKVYPAANGQDIFVLHCGQMFSGADLSTEHTEVNSLAECIEHCSNYTRDHWYNRCVAASIQVGSRIDNDGMGSDYKLCSLHNNVGELRGDRQWHTALMVEVDPDRSVPAPLYTQEATWGKHIHDGE